MRILIAAILSAALLYLLPSPATQINNSDGGQKTQAVQAESPRKEITDTDNVAIKEKAQTDQQTVPKPEIAVATPEPVKATEPTPQTGCEAYRHLFQQYDWPVNTALAICQAESSGNTQAVNWGDNHGKCKGSFSLMQVGCFWYPYYGYAVTDRFTPEVNVKIAYEIYKRQGSFKAWTTYTQGRYLKFL